MSTYFILLFLFLFLSVAEVFDYYTDSTLLFTQGFLMSQNHNKIKSKKITLCFHVLVDRYNANILKKKKKSASGYKYFSLVDVLELELLF